MFPSIVCVARSSSVSQNQTKNRIGLQTFTISIGFQRADSKHKSNMATDYQKVTLTPHSQLSVPALQDSPRWPQMKVDGVSYK